jgi:surfeit locus 1 family protein
VNSAAASEERPRRSLAVVAVAATLALGFSALGVWQLQRLAWKLDLIARVDARVHAPATTAPSQAQWSSLTPKDEAYRHVQVSGTFDNTRETLVQAVTEQGPGYWVMTPLRASAGYTVLVNRGFVPAEMSAEAVRRAGLIAGPAMVTGLLRLSEPHGGFLRANQPARNLWYSRDVTQIARARQLSQVAPYFIDADGTPNNGEWPRGGLTVVRFRNSHLVYALTWFALAGMSVVWGAWPAVEAARARRVLRTDPSPAHGQYS